MGCTVKFTGINSPGLECKRKRTIWPALSHWKECLMTAIQWIEVIEKPNNFFGMAWMQEFSIRTDNNWSRMCLNYIALCLHHIIKIIVFHKSDFDWPYMIDLFFNYAVKIIKILCFIKNGAWHFMCNSSWKFSLKSDLGTFVGLLIMG